MKKGKVVFGTAPIGSRGNLFGLFSVDGSGRWIPSDGRRWKGEETERTGAGGREREGGIFPSEVKK